MREVPMNIGITAVDPQTAIVLKSLEQVDSIVNAYKEYKIADSIEQTKRVACREQAKVAIRQLEENTRQYISRSHDQKEFALSLVDTLNNILQNRELLDEGTYYICQKLIQAAVETMTQI